MNVTPPTGRQFVRLAHPSRPTLRTYATKSNGDFVDYYHLLQVDTDATVEEIKHNYRRLQKRHHPDVSGQQETSSVLNRAYHTLVDPHLRQTYDRRLASVPPAQRQWRQSLKDQPGIIGPLSNAEIVMQRTIFEHRNTIVRDEKMRENIVWLREWAKTFIFAADLPLPMPLQCDDIAKGVRLAFITTTQNRIRSAGELHFVIESAAPESAEASALSLSVYRVVPSQSYGIILGEHRVMKAFRQALQDKEETHREKHRFFGFELSGLAASAAAQFMPVLATIPCEQTHGSSYEAYHLKHPIYQNE